MEATLTLPTPTDAKVVEGSDGMLLEIDGHIVPNYDATIVPFDEGDVVTGKVVRIDKDEVLIDIGYKSEGVIPRNELSIRKSVDPSEEVELGEEVDALVLTKEDQDGRLILSKKRARFERAWRKIEAAAESGEPVIGAVIEVVKGGLIIDLGVRGFLPASLVDIRRVPNLDEYLGQNIQCKVIELNRSRNNVVLSRRAVLEEERKEQRQAILERLQPGLIIEGQISNIVDFGAFVDLDGIDGLIHISELSWSHVNHPSEILSIGDTVQVKVLDIDRDRQRISLGLKQTQEDPWQRVVDTYNVGDELEGAVTKVVAFGAFVEIMDGVEGLVHISELAQQHVENPREIVAPGDEIRVRILEIDSERRRLSLSIKRVEDQILPPQRRPAATPATSTTCPSSACPRTFPERPGDACRGGAVAEDEAPAPRSRGRSRRPRPDEAPRPRPSRRGRPRPTRRLRPSSRRRAEPTTPAATSRPTSPEPGGRGAPVRRSDRRHRRRQVRGTGRARPPGRGHHLRGRRGARALRRPARCAPPSSTRWGEDVAPGGKVDRAAIAARAFADAERARVAGGHALAQGRRADRRVARRRVPARPRAAGARRRDAAALRGRPGVRLRRHDRRRRRRGRARPARRRARPRGGRRADRAPAHAGPEGATCDVRGRELRQHR